MKHYFNPACQKILVVFIALLLLSGMAGAQTNPSAFDLSTGSFSFTGFALGTTTTYPTSMQGHAFAAEPTTANITNAANSDAPLVVSTSGIATGSFRNEVANGVSILNSGSNNYGAIVVAINTTGRASIQVTFTAQQLNDVTTRVNGLRMQYRVGTSGSFTDVSPTTEYLTTLNGTNGASTFTNVALPPACNNQAVVHVRWIYYSSSGSGARDRIRLDDITIASSAGSSVADPASFSATAASAVQINLAASANSNGNNIAVAYNSTGTFTIPTDGVAPPTNGNSFAGGTILYSGAAASLTNHTGLSSNTQYFYKAFSYDGSNIYSAGLTTNATTLTLSAPVASNATPITSTAFNANWGAVTGANSYRLDVSTSPTFTSTANATDLFISEYVEGSSSNKYIEIYNGTGATVNLSDYQLRLYANGAASPSFSLTLSGTLTNGSTAVYAHPSATVYGGTVTNTLAVNFNGNDAVSLFKISTSSLVDVFGRIGEDPGTAWTSGPFTTVDKTLVRKSTVTSGVSTNPASGFPTLSTEWDQSNTDVVSNLGTHTFSSTVPSFVTGYNNSNPGNVVTAPVTGLTTGTYYFRVRATDGTYTSTNSSTITVTINDPATADFRTKAAGNFSATGTWEYNSGFSGVNVYANALAVPVGTNNIDVQHKLLLDQDFTINNGKTFTLNSSLTTADTFRIDPNRKLTVAGTANFNSKPVTFLSSINGTGILGQVTGTVSNATNVTAEQYIPSKRAWRFMSGKILGGSQTINAAWQEGQTITTAGNVLNNKPGFGTHITGGTAGNGFDQTQSNNYSIRTWTPAQASGWSVTPPSPASTVLSSRNGYALFIRGSRAVDLTTNTSTDITILRATGSLNTGSTTQSFTGIATGDFLLAGNPYISPVNFTGLGATALENRIWLWDPKLGTVGGYVLMDAGTNTRTGASGGSYAAFSTTIASGLAFFVRSTGASASLGYTEASKTAPGLNVYRQQPLPRVYVYLQHPVSEDSVTNLDGIAAVFGRNYHRAVTTEDAAKLNNFTENIAFTRNGVNLALEAHPLFTNSDTLFLNLYYTKVQDYRFTINPENVPELNGVSAVLEDLFLATTTPLSPDQPTVVPFAVTADTNSYGANRFRIILNRTQGIVGDATGINVLQETAASISVYPNPVTGGTLNILMNKMLPGQYEMTLYNNSAHAVWNRTLVHDGGTKTYYLPAGNGTGNGVYTLSARDKNGVVKTANVIFAGK